MKIGDMEVLTPIEGMHRVEQILRTLDAEVHAKDPTREDPWDSFTLFALARSAHGLGAVAFKPGYSFGGGEDHDVRNHDPIAFIISLGLRMIESGEGKDGGDLLKHMKAKGLLPTDTWGFGGSLLGFNCKDDPCPHPDDEPLDLSDGRHEKVRLSILLTANHTGSVIIRTDDQPPEYIYRRDVFSGGRSFFEISDFATALGYAFGAFMQCSDRSPDIPFEWINIKSEDFAGGAFNDHGSDGGDDLSEVHEDPR